ncbi:MAG TPA: carboxypeptidase-like regulatory domain-containing protein [Longimicrobium sp.]|nr:carboxypeptidase-like regulatory domain-containing protein [Longimicrobium sp.]
MSTLVGKAIDEHTKEPVANVMVTADSPALPGGKTVFTGAQGNYSIGDLSAGTYVLRFQADGYYPCSKTGIHLRDTQTERTDVELLAVDAATASA